MTTCTQLAKSGQLLMQDLVLHGQLTRLRSASGSTQEFGTKTSSSLEYVHHIHTRIESRSGKLEEFLTKTPRKGMQRAIRNRDRMNKKAAGWDTM